jgi:serine/threonine protein kinase
MRGEFRVKEGGRGNVVSDAQNGGLTLARLNSRNPAVAGTPISRDYLTPLVILYNNKYYEQLSELLEEWQKKTSNLDDFYAFADEAIALFNSPTPANFVIIYARALMLHQTLLHKMQQPPISADDKGSYSGSSGAILVGNGGTIGDGCIFHHAVSWQYIVEQLDFNPSWQVTYEGVGELNGLGAFRSEPWCDGTDGYLVTFAPFGTTKKSYDSALNGDVTQTKWCGIDIQGMWTSFPDGRVYYQLSEGVSGKYIKDTPLKYLDAPSSYLRLTKVDKDNSQIVSEDYIDYLPIFKMRSKNCIPLQRNWQMQMNSNGDYLVVADADSVISLEDFQKKCLVKSPFLRDSSIEQDSLIYLSSLREWIDNNIVPPHMSSQEWWNQFYEWLEKHIDWKDERECGEYEDSNGNLCGVVYYFDMNYIINEDARGTIQSRQLPNDYPVVFRTTERASDYGVPQYGAIEVSTNYNHDYSNNYSYKTQYNPAVRIRIKMNIGDGWTMLPEDAVRNALKQYNQINNCIFTDGDVANAVLYRNGLEFSLIPSTNGASIDLLPILANADVDFDNMPLDELIDTLREGFVVTYHMNRVTGTYVTVNATPSKLVTDWRDK